MLKKCKTFIEIKVTIKYSLFSCRSVKSHVKLIQPTSIAFFYTDVNTIVISANLRENVYFPLFASIDSMKLNENRRVTKSNANCKHIFSLRLIMTTPRAKVVYSARTKVGGEKIYRFEIQSRTA